MEEMGEEQYVNHRNATQNASLCPSALHLSEKKEGASGVGSGPMEKANLFFQ